MKTLPSLMIKNLTARVDIEIDAPASRVWQALTNVAEVKQYGSVRSWTAQHEDDVGAPTCRGCPIYTAAASAISERQRAMKSCRCSASETLAAFRLRTRKYCRNSSNAVQNRDADSKLPKPSIG
jgi:hypothetical protein